MEDLFENLEESGDGGSDDENEVLSVSDFLDLVNDGLKKFRMRVQGEVIDTSLYPERSYSYFDIKDPDQDKDGKLTCFIWNNKYKLSDVDLEEGMEVIVEGYPKVHKPRGGFNFQTSTIELSGEGALMKAYKELKEELKKKGVFSPENKKSLPRFAENIGLITSRGSDAEADFLSSLGSFGFKIHMKDSRVEGKSAVEDLVEAVNFFQDKDVDVLVITRGGGSVEALQAFDNRNLVEAVFNSSIPVISGVGHHKDVPLVALAADKQASNPRDVAAVITEPWKEARSDLKLYQKSLVSNLDKVIGKADRRLESFSAGLRNGFEDNIIGEFRRSYSKVLQAVNNFSHKISKTGEGLDRVGEIITKEMSSLLDKTNSQIEEAEKVLHMNNPERQLELGYSLVSSGGDVIRSVENVNIGDEIDIRVSDGRMESEVKNKKKD